MAVELKLKGKERQGQWMYNRIMCLKYNAIYREFMSVGLPDYLREGGAKGRQKILAKVRCGNEEEANRHWATEEQRRSRICGAPESRLEHLVEHGRQTGKREIRIKDIVDARGLKEEVEYLKTLNKYSEEVEAERRDREEKKKREG